MLSLLHRALLLCLVPALLLAGTADRAYALFACASMQRTQASCCCPDAAPDAPCEDSLERASCCSEQTVHVQTAPASASPQGLLAVMRAPFVRLLLRDLYAPVRVHTSFALREAPRALGPPLIILHRVLRL